MREGDIVVASRGNRRIQAIGLVSGPYQFEHREIDEYHHGRPVEWRWTDDTGEGIPVADMYPRHLSQQSIYQMNDRLIYWEVLLPYLPAEESDAPPPPHVLIIDEINRANVSKVMGELITLLQIADVVGKFAAHGSNGSAGLLLRDQRGPLCAGEARPRRGAEAVRAKYRQDRRPGRLRRREHPYHLLAANLLMGKWGDEVAMKVIEGIATQRGAKVPPSAR